MPESETCYIRFSCQPTVMRITMSAGSYYYEILGLSPAATTIQVKKAYHVLVHRNHPDLFADERKRLQELKMVQINEAYTRIFADRTALRAAQPDQSGNGIRVKSRGRYDVGFHHDIEYVYYKQGFENFSVVGSAFLSPEGGHLFLAAP